MERIALFNIEYYSSSEAIINFIEKHHDKIAIVVTRDRYSSKHGNLLQQIITNYYRAGFDFVISLAYNSIFYFLMLCLSQLISSITGRKRKPFTISEICYKYQIHQFKTSNINGEDIIADLKQANLDIIVIYFFDQIIKEQIIQIPKKAVINVHAALLPKCKGLFPVLYSDFKNERKFAITIYEIIDTSIDSGAVLAQDKLKIDNTNYSILTLDKLVNNQGIALLTSVVNNFDYYYLKRTPQILGGSYFSFPARNDIKAVKTQGFSLGSFQNFVSDFFE